MKILKSFLYVTAADILSLFIGFTLASSGSFFIRLLSAVCTSGILVCLLISLAVKTAVQDLKDERINGRKRNPAVPVSMGIAASLPSAVSWIILKSGKTDFYRWHKIINGCFLQIYNFINSSASSADLTSGQINIMLILVFVPAAVFLTAYLLIYKGVISSGK